MDEAVIGLEAGDERSVQVRFPDEHPREELRGRGRATLTLRVVEVKEKEVPPLDDELARGARRPRDARRAARRGADPARRRGRAPGPRRALEEAAVDAVLARHEFVVPESLVLREVSHRIGHARERLRRQGVDPDAVRWDYAEAAGELRPDAERAVRRALLLEAIAEREELTSATPRWTPRSSGSPRNRGGRPR